MDRGMEQAGSAGRTGLSGSSLKYIAMASMLIDHIGVGLLYFALNDQGAAGTFPWFEDRPWDLYSLYLIFRMIGRIAFPVYCFLLVEGFCHTRNWKKYAGRMLLFAVLSEIPFDLAAFNTLWYPGHQNVFFELLIGLFVLKGMEYAGLGRRPLFELLVVAYGCAAAWILRADYDVTGILLIAALYYTRENRERRTLVCGLMGFLETWPEAKGIGALSAVFLWFYNGKKGKSVGKYAYYGFYPLHLLIISAVRVCILIRV